MEQPSRTPAPQPPRVLPRTAQQEDGMPRVPAPTRGESPTASGRTAPTGLVELAERAGSAEQPPVQGSAEQHEQFWLVAADEDMAGAGIHSGDRVLVRACPVGEVPNNETVAVRLDGRTTLRRLSRQQGRVWLKAANPAVMPRPGSAAEVLGVVTATRARRRESAPCEHGRIAFASARLHRGRPMGRARSGS
ncbi:LexA family protein [Allostreptomyces psammosilenae]|uniref:Peptidase S24/S26A/S26B/S26C domain-containing protein n=1 Tax=Allostreptomyces psammosilenae TaxID=1892865 RepID=A0A853AAI2_9ACTN|nr:S24 family peptidase [Allostreptomyces psammosilenae]NYI07382.1 hypothetical protein [Allostreptomyces psammosilenae]